MKAMQAMGLSSNFQASLMSEEYKDMRLSDSLKDWTIEMMKMRFGFLMSLDNVIKAPPSQSIDRKVSWMDVDGSMKTLVGSKIPSILQGHKSCRTFQTARSAYHIL